MSFAPLVQREWEQVLVAAVHWPAALQVWPEEQAPQEPPQPSLPQDLPEQLGVQVDVHWPAALQVWPDEQLPQEPPQPSLPQDLPEQLGVHAEPVMAGTTWVVQWTAPPAVIDESELMARIS